MPLSPLEQRAKLAQEMTHRVSHSQMSPEDARWLEARARYINDLPLEEPMFSPLDLIGTGIPTKIASAVGALGKVAGREGLRQIDRAMMEGSGPLATALAPAAPKFVVKPKGGNWLAGSVEDALAGLKRANVPDPALGGNPNDPRMALNNWIEGPLTKYVKTRMATPEDEVRALAEQGMLHFDPPQRGNTVAVVNRRMAGYPQLSEASTESARRWEDLVDAIPGEAGYIDHVRVLGTQEPASIRGELRRLGGQFAVDNPEAKAYSWNRGYTNQDLGFHHLIDELSNAMNPASGLPKNLQLTPEAVKQMSMEKAVRRVADINAWREANRLEANRALAEQTSLVRDYPHSEAMPNPKGLRWVELKKQESLPEGWSFKPGEGEYAGYDWFFDPQGIPHNALNDPRNQMLADQLKYEGDIMGHCVGNYCPDVMEGRSRIFSLRNKKTGEPHVTVEVQPYSKHDSDFVFYELEDKLGRRPTQEEWDAAMAQKEPKIVQIKGKGNRAPTEEYLPFVQDFVRNSPLGQSWGEVQEARNAGLRKATDVFNSNELAKLQQAGAELPAHGWLGGQDIQQLHNLITPEGKRLKYDTAGNIIGDEANNFARGGAVHGYAGGGVVESLAKLFSKYLASKEIPQEQKMLMGVYRGYSGDFPAARPGIDIYATPQRRAAEYYAARRAAETGTEPHVEMLMVDPFAGKQKSLSLPMDKYNDDVVITKARKLEPADIESDIQLYAQGGAVSSAYDKNAIDAIVNRFYEEQYA